MSDRNLRALARRAALGDLDAGARLLRERIRAGRLSTEDTRLAAYLGDPASQSLTGHRSRTEDFDAWCEELAMWGPGVCVHAALTMVEHLDPWWRQVPFRWLVDTLYAALLDARNCPCVEHDRLLRRWQRRARKSLRGLSLPDVPNHRWSEAIVTRDMRVQSIRCLVQTATAALSSPRQAEVHAAKALRAAVRALSAAGETNVRAEVRRIVEAELRAWALAD